MKIGKCFDEWCISGSIPLNVNKKIYSEIIGLHIIFSEKGDPEKLVLFDQGAEVDFLFRYTSDLDHIIKNGRIPEGFQRGGRMLLE